MIKNITGRIFLTIFLALILLSGYFIAHSYEVHIKTAEENILSNLFSISKTLSVQMDGHKLKMVLEMFPEKDDIDQVDQHPYYLTQYQILKKTKELNGINTSIYTLTFDSTKKEFFFGITSSDEPFYRHPYGSFPKELLENYATGGMLPIFEDQNGVWLSSFSPVMDGDEVVGVVLVDMPFEQFIADARMELFENIAVAIIIFIIVGFVVYRLLGKILKEDEERKQALYHSYQVIEQKNDELKEKNEAITDSISYAKRIQEALLPSKKWLRSHLKDCLIYYQPKDIVAGDFYWFQERGDYVYLAAGDCTGHGVPGAMVSVVCVNALNRVVTEMKIEEPCDILDKVANLVEVTFDHDESEIHDGMDIALCRINTKTNEVTFSGANNPLYLFTEIEKGERLNGKAIYNGENKLVEFKGDKQPIGKFPNHQAFTQTSVKLKEGDSIFLFTDGYPDQFGGEQGRKYMYKTFKKMLLNLHGYSMKEQEVLIHQNLLDWKGNFDQVDDICVLGWKAHA